MKTWWISKTWWKLGEFTRFSPGFHQVFTKKKKKRFYTSKFHQRKRFSVFFKYAFYGEIWVEFGEILKLGEHLVNFQNLVKIWCISKTWWIFKTWWKTWWISKSLVNTGLFPKPDGNLVNLQNLVKSWSMPKPGENLVSPNKRKKRFAHWRILVKRLLHSTPKIR